MPPYLVFKLASYTGMTPYSLHRMVELSRYIQDRAGVVQCRSSSGLLQQEPTHVMPFRRIHAHPAQQSFEHQFHQLLCLTHHVGIGLGLHERLQGQPALACAQKIAARQFVGGHSVMQSPSGNPA